MASKGKRLAPASASGHDSSMWRSVDVIDTGDGARMRVTASTKSGETCTVEIVAHIEPEDIYDLARMFTALAEKYPMDGDG